MWKAIVAGTAALAIAGTSLVYAQQRGGRDGMMQGWRPNAEDQRAFGWARPPWYDRVAVEHAAMRERLGIIDMTSFGKLETSDLDVLERVCGAQ